MRSPWPSLRDEFIEAYGGKCECCDETIGQFLTLEHKNGDGSYERARGLQTTTIIRKLKKEGWPKSESYGILCMNCNFAKKRTGECPHDKILNREPRLYLKRRRLINLHWGEVIPMIDEFIKDRGTFSHQEIFDEITQTHTSRSLYSKIWGYMMRKKRKGLIQKKDGVWMKT